MVLSARGFLITLAVVAIAAIVAVPVASAAKPKKAPRAHLAAFGSCQALVGYAHRNAALTGGGVGVPARAPGSVATLAAPVQKTTDANGAIPPVAVPSSENSGRFSAAPTASPRYCHAR